MLMFCVRLLHGPLIKMGYPLMYADKGKTCKCAHVCPCVCIRSEKEAELFDTPEATSLSFLQIVPRQMTEDGKHKGVSESMACAERWKRRINESK